MLLSSIEKVKSLKNKKVLIRVDFNVPIENGKVKDDYRIVSALPTLNHLISAGAKVVIMAHLGDPGGKPVPELSLKPVAKRLSQLIKKTGALCYGNCRL